MENKYDSTNIHTYAIEDTRLTPSDFRIYCMMCESDQHGFNDISLRKVNRILNCIVTDLHMRSILRKLQDYGYIDDFYPEYWEEDESNFYKFKLIKKE